MNDQASGRDTEKAPEDCPPMTVLPVADDPTRFYCLGNSGWWYEVRIAADAKEWACECPHRKFRGAVCHHITAVAEFTAAGLLGKAGEEIDTWQQMSESERKSVFA